MKTVALALALASAASVAMLPGSEVRAAGAVTISSAGSTLMYPLMDRWTRQYQSAEPGVHVTVAATGSGAGIKAAIAGAVQMGASDAYMTDEQMAQSPGMLNIPLAISWQLVSYNLPGLKSSALKLDGPTLAGIYTGNVRFWDDAPIAAMNPGVALPHKAIVAIHRGDSSGNSFIFSQYLTFSTDSWEFGPSFGTDIAWPAVPGAKAATGNDGMVKALAATPYGIAYIGASLAGNVAKDHLGIAMLKNQAGEYLAPSAGAVRAAAAELSPRTPKDERLSLVFAPGTGSYPLVNYEYAIVAAKQEDGAKADALRKFLRWTIGETQGNDQTTLDPLHFASLPEMVRALSDAQIQQIG